MGVLTQLDHFKGALSTAGVGQDNVPPLPAELEDHGHMLIFRWIEKLRMGEQVETFKLESFNFV